MATTTKNQTPTPQAVTLRRLHNTKRDMESTIRLKATDRQADYLNENYPIKLIEFIGDKEQYPEMDYNSSVVHPWRVIVRHKDEIGKLHGTYTYERLIKILTA